MKKKSEELFNIIDFDEESYKLKNTKSTSRKAKSNNTYIITVSLGKGCYRHIKISGDATLEELHSVILIAFEFIDDHAHAFFLNNRAWTYDEAYYSQYIEDEERYTCDYTIANVISDKQKFVYVFDFGESWEFKCRVLRILDEPYNGFEIIRSVGDAPEQYPIFDF